MSHPLALPRFLLVFVCWLAGLGSTHAQFGLGESKQVTPSLVADTAAIAPGKPFTAGVRLKMEPGWHVYTQFPGDSGAPPRIDWELPEGFQAGAIQWPIPTAHLDEGDMLTYVYENDVLFMVEITPPATLPPGDITLKAKINWLVCEKICVPGQGEVDLKLPAGEAAPANAELFGQWRTQLPKTAGAPFQVQWDRSKVTEFSLRIEGLPKDFKAEFFPLPPEGAKPAHPKTSAIAADGTRTITFPIEEGGAPNLPWRGVLATGKGDAPREGWLISAADSGNSAPATATESAPVPASQNLFALLWSAFLGGLILNLMPCVLPVIALKIFGFVQQAGEEPRRVFRLGLAFVGGVFAFFLGLAALIVGLKAAGINLTWGFQFQNVGILVGLIALVFLFGLNLLGVFEIALSGEAAGKLSELSSKEGYAGAFLHGMFTTLLGTSCTAPFLGAVLGFAFVAPPHIVVILFTAIAAGMSLPYFLLTANPAWMRFLPKPGTWMERLKQFMGFIMLAVVVWLLGVLGQSRGIEPLIAVSSFLLVLSVASWIYGVSGGKVIGWVLIVALVVGGWFVLLNGKLASTKQPGSSLKAATEGGIAWEAWSDARVTDATKSGQPVFVDFTADWCLNCKYNEKFVLETEPVRAALKAKKVLPLKADWTNADPAITAILKKHGRVGVPVYLLYPGNGGEPVLLPEILTQSSLLEALGKIGG
jgi:thiol:disulfide interchange protein DsbD